MLTAWLSWAQGILGVATHVFFQKWQVRKLPALEDMKLDVAGLTCIVTGPTSGIGRQTATALIKRRAHVVLACRDMDKGKRLEAELKAAAGAAGDANPCIEVQLLDVSDTLSVRSFAGRWGTRPLNVLINNAGIFNFGEARRVTQQGTEIHMATNCWGPHLLTLLLLPALTAGAKAGNGRPSRIVNVTSRLHRMGHPGASRVATRPEQEQEMQQSAGARLKPPQQQQQQRPENQIQQQQQATGHQLAKPSVSVTKASSLAYYATSKFTQVALLAELARRLAAEGAPVVCVLADPGEVLTDITRTLPAVLRQLYVAVLPAILLTVQQGARSSVYAAAGALDSAVCQEGLPCLIIGPECNLQEADSRATSPAMGRMMWQEAPQRA